MQDEKAQEPEEGKLGETTTDWAGLRAQADKLGITLSQLQQLQFEKKMRLARKARSGAPPAKDGALAVARNISTGRYEAYSIAVDCGR